MKLVMMWIILKTDGGSLAIMKSLVVIKTSLDITGYKINHLLIGITFLILMYWRRRYRGIWRVR